MVPKESTVMPRKTRNILMHVTCW